MNRPPNTLLREYLTELLGFSSEDEWSDVPVYAQNAIDQLNDMEAEHKKKIGFLENVIEFLLQRYSQKTERAG